MTLIAAPNQLVAGIRSTFIEGLQASAQLPLLNGIATYMNTNLKTTSLAWLGEVAGLAEWAGSVQYNGLSDAKMDVEVLKYTGGLEISRDDLADEQTGGLRQRTLDLAARAQLHNDSLISDVLTGGTALECYDSSYLFTTTHAARGDSGIQSNIVTQTGTTTATVLADVTSAVAGLYNMKDEAGYPLNRGLRQVAIVYPPALRGPMTEAVYGGVIAQTSNVRFASQQMVLIEEPLLTATSAANFYVTFADASVRGVMFVEREPITLESQESEDSDNWFNLEVARFKVRKRCKAVPGRWQRIVKVA